MIQVFEQTGDWEAVRAAEEWLTSEGYSFGTMQAGSPRGIMKGEYTIQKWRNLRPTEIQKLHGKMEGNMRNGPVTVEIFE